jgi:glutamyl-Q tRNA(Asp) synthetase
VTARALGLSQASRGEPLYRGRFAPSPTGPLHFGSLVAALASFLDARARAGQWLVRIEDLDTPRTVPGAADAILRVLEAFGLEWDGDIVRQSDRGEIYRAALERLRAAGAVYRCRCSRREVADSGVAGIDGPVYPGTCRDLDLSLETPGADRLRVPQVRIAFDDRVLGAVEHDIAGDFGDFVLRRRDGLFAYQLAVVVDDEEQGITDVVRGADLLHSTPRQILLQRLLGYRALHYAHVPVATHANGQKLSKQSLAAPVDPAQPREALCRALAFLGQPVPEGAQSRELVSAAAKSWNLSAVPRQYAIAIA